jgi:hypothetical protein
MVPSLGHLKRSFVKSFSLFASVLSILAGTQSFAHTLSCTAKGSAFGITQILAQTNDQTGQISSVVSVKGADGKPVTRPAFVSKGSLSSEFQVSDEFYNGPFGIKKAVLVSVGKTFGQSENTYILYARTYCNSYYQEEKCMEGDLIEQSADMSVKCNLL